MDARLYTTPMLVYHNQYSTTISSNSNNCPWLTSSSMPMQRQCFARSSRTSCTRRGRRLHPPYSCWAALIAACRLEIVLASRRQTRSAAIITLPRAIAITLDQDRVLPLVLPRVRTLGLAKPFDCPTRLSLKTSKCPPPSPLCNVSTYARV